MIAIIDSGSTKCDWVLISNDGIEQFRVETKGFNPLMTSEEDMLNELEQKQALVQCREKVDTVYFYGAGCTQEHQQKKVSLTLQQFFKKATIKVTNDLYAAALAVYSNKPSIVCILGTGSNASYFDGKELRSNHPSLGYILGDEGSGNHLGKKILKNYFLHKLPKHLEQAFEKKYALSIQDLYENIYQKTEVNRYLASFSRFVADNKHEPFIQHMVYEALMQFFTHQVMPYPQARSVEINFVGSIAYYYEDILKAVASNLHLEIGVVIRKPIDNLVNYHIQQIHS